MTAMIRATEAMGEAASEASESLLEFIRRDAATIRAERERQEQIEAILREIAPECTNCGGSDGTQRSRLVKIWMVESLTRETKVVGAPALCDDCAEGAS